MNAYRVLTRNPEGNRTLKETVVGMRMLVRWILEKQDRVIWTGIIWLRIRTTGGLL
jgi:hypothetical protein